MRWRFFLPLAVAGILAGGARAAEVMPPVPPAYFNDYAGVVSPGAANSLNAELDQFERGTSSQIVVAIFPKMESDSSVEDYTVRVAQAWAVGQKGRSNGAVLFVFVQEHQVRIVTGYGLEGALPDARCKEIIENDIAPRFRQGDYDGGLAAGVASMLAAARGEYQGNGRTRADDADAGAGAPPHLLGILIFFGLIVASSVLRSRQQVVYGGGGRRSFWGGGIKIAGYGFSVLVTIPQRAVEDEYIYGI